MQRMASSMGLLTLRTEYIALLGVLEFDSKFLILELNDILYKEIAKWITRFPVHKKILQGVNVFQK